MGIRKNCFTGDMLCSRPVTSSLNQFRSFSAIIVSRSQPLKSEIAKDLVFSDPLNYKILNFENKNFKEITETLSIVDNFVTYPVVKTLDEAENYIRTRGGIIGEIRVAFVSYGDLDKIINLATKEEKFGLLKQQSLTPIQNLLIGRHWGFKFLVEKTHRKIEKC